MVKIENEYGDRYTGKSGNAIYQGHYGKTIRRKGYHETGTPSPRQVQIRNRFKEASTLIKNLPYEHRQGIKNIYHYLKEKEPRLWPVNWYNFAKQIYIKKPEFIITDKSNNEYQINYLSIYRIQEISADNTVLFDSSYLSDPFNLIFLKIFKKVPHPNTTIIKIFPIPGVFHEVNIIPVISSLRFFDNRFFETQYFT